MLLKVYLTAVLCYVLVLGLKDFEDNVFVKRPKFNELPTNRDLTEYLEALNRLVEFSNKYKDNIDISYYFGIFLVNVNLKRALREKYRVLPKTLHTCIRELTWKTESLLDFFKDKVDKNEDLRNNKYKIIFSLFANPTAWITRLPKIHKLLEETEPVLDFQKVAVKWISYRKDVDDRNAWMPTPRQSDLCLDSLASAEVIKIGSTRRCKVNKFCYEMVQNGTNFGYALTHRLLFLQQARFARGCSVYSEHEDMEMRQRFCSTAYKEAEYIALHDFEIVDLLLEHICLCGLEGFVQFLKPSWLTRILRFQTSRGCFSQFHNESYTVTCSQSIICKVTKSDEYDVRCNGHTTAVAAGTLALAIKFILQLY